MYLTRVVVGLEEALQQGLRDAYAWHQAVWDAFPRQPGKARDFLTRLDQQADSLQLLILSPREPQAPCWGLWESKAVAPAFLRHDRYVFSLRANPTTKRVVRDQSGNRRKNGRRTRICSERDLVAWLARKGSGAGFALESGVSVAPPVDQVSWKRRTRIVHARVDFSGRLRVTDRQQFVAAYRTGIGPAKGFGFGLLLLKPIAGGTQTP